MFVIRKISVGIKTRSGALFTSWFPPVKSARVPSFAGRGGGWRERLTNSLRSHRETVKMRPERPLKSLITISARKASEKPWIHALAWGTRAMRRRWASSREKKNTPPPHDTFIPTFLWKIFHWKIYHLAWETFDRFVIEETELSNGNVEMQLQGAAALFSSLSHSPALNWKYKLTMDIKINNLGISF